MKWNNIDTLPPEGEDVLTLVREVFAPDDIVIMYQVDEQVNGRFLLLDHGEEVLGWARLPSIEDVVNQLEGEK